LERIDTPIPNTSLYLTTFDVSYTIPSGSDSDKDDHQVTSSAVVEGDNDVNREVVERGIMSDRIRLYADSEGSVLGLSKKPALSTASEIPLVIESTGNAPLDFSRVFSRFGAFSVTSNVRLDCIYIHRRIFYFFGMAHSTLFLCMCVSFLLFLYRTWHLANSLCA
jgi:hypothetical protein